MGGVDMAIRIIVPLVLVALYFTGTVTGTWGVVGLVVAAVFVLTSLVGFCPLYTLLGMNTCKIKSA